MKLRKKSAPNLSDVTMEIEQIARSTGEKVKITIPLVQLELFHEDIKETQPFKINVGKRRNQKIKVTRSYAGSYPDYNPDRLHHDVLNSPNELNRAI